MSKTWIAGVLCAATLTTGLGHMPQAVALTSTQYAVMIDDFERTFGVNSVGAGEQIPRNRCTIPDQRNKVLNPALFDRQVKERAVCEQTLQQLVEKIRGDSTWSTSMDQALTTLGEKYGYTQARQLRGLRRSQFVTAHKGARWSEDLENKLGYLADLDADAKYVLDQARRTQMIRVENLSWTPAVDQTLAPMAKYVPEANTMLKTKREEYLKQWRTASWSPALEDALKPMADIPVAEAVAVRENQRKALVTQWMDKPYSAEMQQALEPLVAYYPAAGVVLADKKAGKTPQLPTLGDSSSSTTTTEPGTAAPQPHPAPAPGGDGSSTSDTWWQVLLGVLGVLGLGGVAFYFAWFGI